MKIIEKNSKKILIIFAFLDAILFISSWREVFTPFFCDWTQYFIIGIIILLHSFVVLSFIFSAYALLLRKKWAYILYYIQFPFRIGFCYLSLGFLTFLAFKIQTIYFAIMIVAILAEFLRLFITINIHKSIKNITTHST